MPAPHPNGILGTKEVRRPWDSPRLGDVEAAMNGLTTETIANETAALRRLAWMLTRDAAASDDLLQDMWLAAVKRPPNDDRPMRPWLVRVMRNNATSTVRSTARARARERAVAAGSSTDPEEFDDRTAAAQLVEELERLPDDHRALLRLVFWEGRSSAECAAALGRPASTVRTQLQRVLARMRKQLDERRGGRAAWMTALLPFVGERQVPVVGTKALVVAGLAGMFVFGAIAIAPNGCGSELARAPSPKRMASASRDAVAPTVVPLASERRRDSTPTSDRPPVTAARMPLPPARPAHPKLAFRDAFESTLEQLAECRDGTGPARVRVTPMVLFAREHDPVVESVELTQADAVSPAEQDCLRQTLLAMAIAQPELDPELEDWHFMPTNELSFDADGQLSHRAIHQFPPLWLVTQHKLGLDLRIAIAECDPNARADATIDVRIGFVPDTGALAMVDALHGKERLRSCAEAAIRTLVAPTVTFEPVRPEDALMDCTFSLGMAGMYTCARLP